MGALQVLGGSEEARPPAVGRLFALKVYIFIEHNVNSPKRFDMHVKKIYRNEAAEGPRFNITNISAALSKATGLDWTGMQMGRVIYATVNWSPVAKNTISVKDAFKALEVGKQAAKGTGWRIVDESAFSASVFISEDPYSRNREFKAFDEYKKWAKENPKVADSSLVVQIGFALRDGLKKKESVGSTAETGLKMALAEFNGNPSRYEDGYEIEDLIDAIGIDEDELEDYEKELDYVISGLAKAGFEML